MRTIYQTVLLRQKLYRCNSLITRLKMQASRLRERPFTISTVFSKHSLVQIEPSYTQQFNQLSGHLKGDPLMMDINPIKLQKFQEVIEKIQKKQKDREQIYELAAKCYILQENYQAAIREYRKAWKCSPSNIIYGINIAICLMETGDMYNAIKLLQKQSTIHSKSSEIYHHIAVANWMIKNYHQTIRNFYTSFGLSAEIKEEFIMRGKQLLSEKRYAEALPFFVKWVIHEKNREEALEGLKDCFIRTEGLEEATQFYNILGEMEEYRPAASYSLALLIFQSGNIKQAQQQLDVALRENPDSFKLNLYQGIVYLQKDDNPKAIAYLNKCLDINPNDTNVLNSLVLAYMKMKDFDQAYILTQRSLAANEKDSISWYSLGTILVQKNQIEDAITSLKKSIELDQTNYLAMEKLANTLYILGDESQANSLLQRANKIKEDLSRS